MAGRLGQPSQAPVARAGPSKAAWRALSPAEKLETLFGCWLNRAFEFLSCPAAGLGPVRLALQTTGVRGVMNLARTGVMTDHSSYYVDRERQRLHMVFQHITTEWYWGYASVRPGPARKTRSMLNLAMLTALHYSSELKLDVTRRDPAGMPASLAA